MMTNLSFGEVVLGQEVLLDLGRGAVDFPVFLELGLGELARTTQTKVSVSASSRPEERTLT